MADGVGVGRSGGADLGCCGGGSRCVARADDDVVLGLRQALRERGSERARPAHDRYPHAASSTNSARRRSSSRVRMSVLVREELHVRLRRRVRLVDHERVDQAQVTTCNLRAVRVPPAMRESIRSSGPETAFPPTSGLTATQRARRPSIAARIARHREDRPDREVGVAGREQDRVRGRERLEDAGRRIGRDASLVPDVLHLVLVPAGDVPLLERERAGGGHDLCSQMVVGRGDDPRLDAHALAEPPRHLRQRDAIPELARADEVEPEVEVAEAEPVLAAPLRRRPERVPRLAGTAPAALVVDEPGERVEEAVEIGRDPEAEHLDVVSDVADDREVARREHGGEAAREAGAASPSGQEDDLHACTASSARVRGPSIDARRSRSSPASTSATSSGIATVANGACARKRAALPGP